MIGEYHRSLKMPAAEEIFDLVFYRPVAFVYVRLVCRAELTYGMRITPNQISVMSGFAGIIAAWSFSLGTR